MTDFINKLNYLKEDFIGVRFDFFEVVYFLLILLFTVLFFLSLYFIGEKIRQFFFRKTSLWNERYFISLALGYIVLGTIITLIGFFSLLTTSNLIVFFLLSMLFIIFPLSSFYKSIQEVNSAYLKFNNYFRSFPSWQRLSIILFLGITFLRLLPPETGADAMNYHTNFPTLYLFYQTFRLDPLIHVAPLAIPQLGEMPYVLTIFFNLIDASRFVHYGFYLLCVLLLLSPTFTKNKNNNFYVVLLLITSPLVLHYAPSAYSDFPHLFCFLLTIAVLIKEKILSKHDLFLSAILFGGALATKSFALVYFPSIIIFILIKLYKTHKRYIPMALTYVVSFVTVAIIFPLPWYIYSYTLFAKPIGYSQYSITPSTPSNAEYYNLLMQTLDWSEKLTRNHIGEYSPLLLIGILGVVIFFKKAYKSIKLLPSSLFIIIFLLFYICYPPELFSGRYFLPVFSLLAILVSPGFMFINSYARSKYILFGLVFVLFFYYAVNTLLILPYGLGFAKKENYIERSLLINRTAYYDFEKTFSKHITANEIIATYGLDQFYYAHFIPNNAYLFFKNNTSITQLEKHNITKVLIRGGDIAQFCKDLQISDCKKAHVILLTKYPKADLYLYQITTK